jgi:hypothetical protein
LVVQDGLTRRGVIRGFFAPSLMPGIYFYRVRRIARFWFVERGGAQIGRGRPSFTWNPGLQFILEVGV